MNDTPQNETRERILDAAEALFMAKGFSGVRLRDIADAVDMKHASLYYYVPKGKEQLFIAVVKRSMDRHRSEMSRVIEAAGDDIQAQAYAVSDWLVSQPPIDMVRMASSDLKEIDPTAATELEQIMLHSLSMPMMTAFDHAKKGGHLGDVDPGMASLSLVTLVQTVHHIPADSLPGGRERFGRQLIDMLLFGWLKRNPI